MENFVKLLEEESNSITNSLEKIEQEVNNLYHKQNSTSDETHTALNILEKISDTETALDEIFDLVEKENSYLTKKTDETCADLKTMNQLVDDIEKELSVKCEKFSESSADVDYLQSISSYDSYNNQQFVKEYENKVKNEFK